MFRFKENGSLTDFQDVIHHIYGFTDDRLFSLSDLLSHQERFITRALKGIRKGDKEKLQTNLLVSFSWIMAIANRLHIQAEEAVWQRFPAHCSYCGKRPCSCKAIKPKRRVKNIKNSFSKPKTLAQMQKMFREIYPPETRTLEHAGIHLAEDIGEVSEAIHAFLGEHKEHQFDDIKNELADCISCFFGIANSANINVAKELSRMFRKNCHVCHKAPCICNFSSISSFTS